MVTANYKLTFDALRSELHGRDAWILVLDTKGVNVWCAAAKGTFSAEELVRRIGATNLPALVSHNVLIVPQLGAVGVTAREVHAASGFRVVFGPVYAADLPRFLESGIKSPDMHTVRFSTTDRLVLVPAELGSWTMKALLVAACLVLLAGFGPEGFSTGGMMTMGGFSFGCVWLRPSRQSFSARLCSRGCRAEPSRSRACGWDCCWQPCLSCSAVFIEQVRLGVVDLVAWCLAIPAISSFITMGFTGATPYTSVSGVRREMRTALPLQIAAAAAALVAWVAAAFCLVRPPSHRMAWSKDMIGLQYLKDVVTLALDGREVQWLPDVRERLSSRRLCFRKIAGRRSSSVTPAWNATPCARNCLAGAISVEAGTGCGSC